MHYDFSRSTKDVTRFTILLNNMRLMGILDWWMEVLDFIYKMPDDPVLAGVENLLYKFVSFICVLESD